MASNLDLFRNKLEGPKYTLSNNGANLIVNNLVTSDAGQFECVAKSIAGQVKKLAYLTIREQYGIIKKKKLIF